MTESRNAIVPQNITDRVTDGFSSTAIEAQSETVTSILAARAKAEVEARYIVAMKRPRDWDTVRDKMISACKRPGFAGSASEKGSAWYIKPGKSNAEGFTIRFAEEARRAMGNIDMTDVVIFEDEQKRIIQVTVTDMENNISGSSTIVVEKTVERSFLNKGEVAISSRINSSGKITHLKAATDDEVLQKQGSMVSKMRRNLILTLLPGDIQDECRQSIFRMKNGDILTDPTATKKKILDSFSEYGIKPASVSEYLGHSVDVMSPAEISDLRDVFQLVKSGEKSWFDIMTEVAEERGDEAPKSEPVKKGLEAATEKLSSKK
jgi:hypothetical protein